MKHNILRSRFIASSLSVTAVLAFFFTPAWAEKKLPEAQENLKSIQQEMSKLQPEYDRLKGQKMTFLNVS